MSIIRLLVTTIILFVTPLPAAETVKIDGHAASATSVMAKIKSAKGTKGQVAQALSTSPNVAGVRGYVNIPSVVVIDLKAPAKKTATPTAASDKAAAGELARRIAELQATGLFEYVEPDYIVRPNNLPSDAAFGDGRLWGLRNQGQNGGVAGADIDAPAAWQTTTGNSDVVVAVIDTGIRYTHTDLTANMWINPGEIPGNGVDDDGNGFVDDIHGINAVNGSGDPIDTNGHGSHCAGTIGAVANGGGPHVGVAWNVRLMALKFLDPSGLTSDAITCIDYAVSKGADIMSNSWGGGGYSQALADAIERAEPQPCESMAATGATRLQIIAFGVLPQVAPALLGLSFYAFEVNVRAAIALGLFGGGGLGFQLHVANSGLRYHDVLGYAIISLLLVSSIERISDQARKRLLNSTTT